jgi:hypothetical protein
MVVNRSILPIAVVAAALACGIAPVAYGQQPSPGPKTDQPASVSDQDIKAFAAAASEVRQLQRVWIPKVEEAGKQGAEEQMKVRQQAISEMTQAVQKNGLSVDRYQEIYQIAQADPEVQRKIRENMPER